ncbi:hypothetical protein AcV5_002927 [Taiwanofungus camphoratus]|nr:hypothetical protein AcV5_002927 [Antrodia cinnamomea]
MVFISNLCDGMDQYRFPSMERIRSFPYAIQRNYPMQVAVDATRMVCGGDDGFARVFDRENGQFLESLMHGSAGTLVQTVEMYSDSNRVLIITAASSGGEADIKIWSYQSRNVHSNMSSDSSLKAARDGTMGWWQILLTVVITTFVINVFNAHFLQEIYPLLQAVVTNVGVMFETDDVLIPVAVDSGNSAVSEDSSTYNVD